MLSHWIAMSPIVIASVRGMKFGHRLEVDAVERERDVLDDERHPDRGDERREPRRVA